MFRAHPPPSIPLLPWKKDCQTVLIWSYYEKFEHFYFFLKHFWNEQECNNYWNYTCYICKARDTAEFIKLLSWKPSDLYDDVMCWLWSPQMFGAPPPSSTIFFSEASFKGSKTFRSPSPLPLVMLNEISLRIKFPQFFFLTCALSREVFHPTIIELCNGHKYGGHEITETSAIEFCNWN